MWACHELARQTFGPLPPSRRAPSSWTRCSSRTARTLDLQPPRPTCSLGLRPRTACPKTGTVACADASLLFFQCPISNVLVAPRPVFCPIRTGSIVHSSFMMLPVIEPAAPSHDARQGESTVKFVGITPGERCEACSSRADGDRFRLTRWKRPPLKAQPVSRCAQSVDLRARRPPEFLLP